MAKYKDSAIFEDFTTTPYISLRPIVFFLIVSNFTVPIFQSESLFSSEALAWFVSLWAVSMLVLAIIFATKYFFELKYGRNIPIYLLLVVGVLIGAIKGGLTQILINEIYFNDPNALGDILIRTYSGSFLGAGITFTLIVFAVFKENTKDTTQQFQLENNELANQIDILTSEIDLLKSYTQHQIVSEVLNNLNIERDFRILAASPEKNWLLISDALRNGLSEKVRLKSHQLSTVIIKTDSIFNRIFATLKLKVLHLHPKIFCAIQISTGVTVSYQNWNPRNSVIALLLNTLVSLAVTTFFANRLGRKNNPSVLYNFTIVILIVFFNDLFYIFVQLIVWGEVSWILVGSVFFWHVTLIYSISAVSEVIRLRERIRESSRLINEEFRDKIRLLSNFQIRIRDEISKHLHGFIAIKINSTAIKLDSLAKSGNFEEYRIVLKDLLDEFSAVRIKEGLMSMLVDEKFLIEITELWDGLIEVEFNGDLGFYEKLQLPQAIELADVISEIINNAYRHGKASRVSISFSWSDEGNLLIKAKDNGAGVALGFIKGLGSTLYSLASEERWRLFNSGNGAVLSLTVSPYDAEFDLKVV